MDAVCGRLHRPERRFACVLIAGTNGKGSTAATLASIASAAGLTAGLYTSPHLTSVTERVRLSGSDVEAGQLDGALAEVFAAADAAPALSLTYFEALTAAAFVLFARWRLDLAVIEVGLGGRLDATNVAPALVSVVTSIGLDHTEDLGPTLPSIAREKAGIFRSGRPALCRARDPAARAALAEAARAAGALWHEAEEELCVSEIQTDLTGTRFHLRTPQGEHRLATPLPGAHQAWNAALAVRAAELLADEVPGLAAGAFAAGVGAVRWPGRLERLVVRGRPVLLDGCHNPEGAAALAQFLKDARLSGRVDLVFGAMADKDVEGMARVLFPQAESVRLVPAGGTRGADPEDLARRVGSTPPGPVPDASLDAALGRLLNRGGSQPIIVAGSLYLVGEARRLLLSGKFETTTP
ncbi:MAG: bifunctional folylpolyglutamate synthase/dihydrofolate synthase [Thermoanaerobaculia bacterium]